MKLIYMYIIITVFIHMFALCSNQKDTSKTKTLVSKVQKDEYIDISVQQEKIIKNFVLENKGWRKAKLSDNKSTNIRNYIIEHPGYDPYLLQADLTHDGMDDFVVVLIKGNDFGVIWSQRKKNGYSTPHWLSKTANLREGGLFLKDSCLWIGACFYCDNTVQFVWNKKINKLVPKE